MRSPDPRAPHAADTHDLIRVHGARENNLRDVSVELPKRRLTVFTGVSGSGKSSLVFATIAAESQRMINETYSAFVQGFLPAQARPDVDVLDGLTTAIIVDQERMGADPRSTVGTATDANAMLRRLYSRLATPSIGGPQAYAFNLASVSGAGAVTLEKGGRQVKQRRSFSIIGGMCSRCEGRGRVDEVDLTALYDDTASLNDGALTIPGYSMEGWYGRILRGCGFFDPDKPIRDFTRRELDDLLHKEATRLKVDGINLTYLGLIPQIKKTFLAKDVDAMQPHVRAFVERAVTFTACPDCHGTRLSAAARSSTIAGVSIADACAMQISDLASWVGGLDQPSVAPLLTTLRRTLDSFVEIGLGYLSLDRSSGTLSGGEAQRTKMIRHLGSSLTDVTYVFDEPTIGLHPARCREDEPAAPTAARQGQHRPRGRAQAGGDRDRRPCRRPGAERPAPRAARSSSRARSTGCEPAARSPAVTSTTGSPPRRCCVHRRARSRCAARAGTTSAPSTSTCPSVSSRWSPVWPGRARAR